MVFTEEQKPKSQMGNWVGLGILAILALAFYNQTTDPINRSKTALDQTPDVLQLEQSATNGDANAKQTLVNMLSQKDAERAELCHLRTVCTTFSSVRQDCATAGSFETCVAVKMGDADKDLTSSCTNDGNIAMPPDRMPQPTECWLESWFG
jgi:hypothetical protein